MVKALFLRSLILCLLLISLLIPTQAFAISLHLSKVPEYPVYAQATSEDESGQASKAQKNEDGAIAPESNSTTKSEAPQQQEQRPKVQETKPAATRKAKQSAPTYDMKAIENYNEDLYGD